MSLKLAFAKSARKLMPLVKAEIPCGKPTVIEDAEIEWIDLNEYLARGSRETTVYIHAVGDSMIEYGIDDGDLLVVDRTAQPENGKRSVVSVNGEYTVKRWKESFNQQTRKKHLYLVPGNSKYKKRELTPKDDIKFFGIVKYVIKKGD